MKRYLLITVVAICGSLGGIMGAHAAETWATHEVGVQFGTARGDLEIAPSRLEFQAGELYRMVVNNPSDSIHYFSVSEFGTTVYTTKIVTTSPGGPYLVRFPFKEQNIQLRPGATLEWVFMPVKEGHYKFGCSISDHAKAGMVGDILVN